MNVTVYYCRLCKLREPAEAIAAALHAELGIAVDVREGFWGTFRIELDGQEVFNRWKTRGVWGRLGFGRTPTPEEIVRLIETHLPQTSAPAAIPRGNGR